MRQARLRVDERKAGVAAEAVRQICANDLPYDFRTSELMPDKTLFIVQQFEKRGRKLTAGRSVEYRTAQEAVARAERDAEKFAGVVALTTTVDTDTGEVVEEPKVLARFGEVSREFADEG